MQPKNFFMCLGKNSFLKIIASILLVLSLLGISYIYSFIILMTAEFIERDFLDKYFNTLRIGITTILTCMFLFLFYDKKQIILSIAKLVFIIFITSFFSGVLAYLFTDSTYWFLKYFIGTVTGILFYWLYKREKNEKRNILSGIVSLFALLLCENSELFLLMDPPDYPSVLYIKSFPNTVLWLGTILFVFFSSYFISKGFWKKEYS